MGSGTTTLSYFEDDYYGREAYLMMADNNW